MAIQKFSLEAIQKVRNAIRAELAIGDTQSLSPAWSELDAEVPEPQSLDDLSDIFTFGGRSEEEKIEFVQQSPWFVSTSNPASVLLKLPGLRLKPEYRLVGYLYRTAPNGAGRIYAVPEALSTTAHLQQALPENTSTIPPQPAGALPHFMAAIDGDRSAVSLMVASLLKRELQEFGAIGNQQNWSCHRLIQALPSKLSWQWRTEPPKDWFPKAMVLPDGQAAVEFFSCRISAQEAVLYRHLDRYSANSYQPTSLDKALAVVRRSYSP
jgi:hypothetical protein